MNHYIYVKCNVSLMWHTIWFLKMIVFHNFFCLVQLFLTQGLGQMLASASLNLLSSEVKWCSRVLTFCKMMLWNMVHLYVSKHSMLNDLIYPLIKKYHGKKVQRVVIFLDIHNIFWHFESVTRSTNPALICNPAARPLVTWTISQDSCFLYDQDFEK